MREDVVHLQETNPAALRGLTAAFAGFDSKEQSEWEEVLSALQGRARRLGSRGVTVVVVPQPKTRADIPRDAAQQRCPVVTTAFLEAVLESESWRAVNVAEYCPFPHDVPPPLDEREPTPPPAKRARYERPQSALTRRGTDPTRVDDDGSAQVAEIVKGSAPLDHYLPQEVQDAYHVYERPPDSVYSCMLNQANLKQNNNKFYHMQLLEADRLLPGHGLSSVEDAPYAVWFRWGRVGLPGSTKLVTFDTLEGALDLFESKFESKTDTPWEQREQSSPREGKYTYLFMDWGQNGSNYWLNVDDDDCEGDSGASSKRTARHRSSLHPTVSRLLRRIASPAMMRKEVEVVGFDLSRLPLGRLSEKTLIAAERVLSEISDALDKNDSKAVTSLSGFFYTLVPHDFRMQPMRTKRLGTKDLVAEKADLLETLRNMLRARSVLSSAARDSRRCSAADSPIHPLDALYDAIPCALRPLDPDTSTLDGDVWHQLERAIQGTHGPTHEMYRLAIKSIIAVDHPEEVEAWSRDGASIGNPRLLWHGSRVGNWMGILARGLRVAPAEAPSTGYMFGKGIYWADCASKAANYSFVSREHNRGYLLVGQVAVGSAAIRRKEADEFDPERLKKEGGTCLLGEGQWKPDPSGEVTVDLASSNPSAPESRAVLDTGPLRRTDADSDGALLYNEYVVYRSSQARMRYLIELDFQFPDPEEESDSD